MADHAGFDPSEVFVYRGRGGIPRNVRWAEVDRSVKFIPACLFKNCDQLEFVLLHEGQGLLRIGNHAFLRCSSLGSIQIPSTVTEIGGGAFYECSNLAAAELPEGLERLENWTFYKCASLEEVRIPTSVARIGDHAFARCTNLRSVDLPEGMRMIGDGAFKNCLSLERVCVPSSVVEIGVHAFDGCRSLSSVRLHEDLPRMKKFAFSGCPPESFRFVRLSQRMEAMRMDDQMTSMFERRSHKIAKAITSYYNYNEYGASKRWISADAVWEKCRKSLERAHEILDYLELKRAMPMVLELAAWKAKIEDEGDDWLQGGIADEGDGGLDARDAVRMRQRQQDPQPSHGDCRVTCGADIVSAEVLKFLACNMSWPRLGDIE